jgi:Tol biopolymer transport system component
VLASVLSARGGSWGSRDVIIYSPEAGSLIWRVNSNGTNAEPVTNGVMSAIDQTHRWPVFLPDGNHFMFWAGDFGKLKDDNNSGIYASSLDKKDRRLVILCHSSFGYDRGHLYYADEKSQLVSSAFDISEARVSGGPHSVAPAVGRSPSTYWTDLSVADNGTVLYHVGAGGTLSALTWMDRAGKELGRVGEPGVMANPAISPDGARIALDINDARANTVDIWIESASGSGNTRFTFDPTEDVTPVWSRDGRSLAYRSTSPRIKLYVKHVSGLEAETSIATVPAPDDLVPNSWTLDDRQILITHMGVSGTQLELVPATGGTRTPFLQGKGSQINGMISPDGKWVAYASDESGNWEIYVSTFPAGVGKWQVSRGSGTEPRWRADGKEIFYIGPKGMLMAVPVDEKSGFSTGTPTPLFQVHARAQISSTDIFTYDVAKDGQRFLVNRYVKPERVAPLTILLHAAAERDN